MDARLDFARKHSGARVVDIRKEDPIQLVKEMTGGRGADFVIEMGANQSALERGLRYGAHPRDGRYHRLVQRPGDVQPVLQDDAPRGAAAERDRPQRRDVAAR